VSLQSIHYDSSLRDSVFSASVVFVVRPTDNSETSAVLDTIVDAFTDFVDAYAHIVAGTVWSNGSWNDEAVPLSDGASAAGARFTFADITFKNGRN
jgi:hypothetical protein